MAVSVIRGLEPHDFLLEGCEEATVLKNTINVYVYQQKVDRHVLWIKADESIL